MTQATWSSLEVAKLIVSGLMPLAVLFAGLWIKRLTEKIEHQRWRTESVMEWRIKIFEQLAPKLNALYCCYCYVGKWKNFTPPLIIELKRDADEIVYTNAFLWSDGFMKKYRTMVSACFLEERGPGRDPGIRANIEMYKKAHKDWQQEWNDLFVESKDRIARDEFRALYEETLRQALQDLGLDGTVLLGNRAGIQQKNQKSIIHKHKDA